jgi:pimeloyl-ACP methyl ester carboxylesterase
VRFYLRAPRLLSPLFLLNSLRLYREIAAASPGVLDGIHAAARHAANVMAHMLSPARMARRVRLLQTMDLSRELASLAVPTLVVTGEPRLDRVVPIRLTEEYMRIFPHAERVTLVRTGHLGLITRPREFAAAAAPFIERNARTETPTNRGGAEARSGHDQVSPRIRDCHPTAQACAAGAPASAVRDVERKCVG